MLTQLAPEQYPAVRPLFDIMSTRHLILSSVLAGVTPASVYSDDPSKPTSALVHFHNKLFFLGNSSPGFHEDLNRLFASQIFPAARQQGAEIFLAFASHPAWTNAYPQLFGSAFEKMYPDAQRQYYAFVTGQNTLYHGWQSLLPRDCVLRPVDADLLTDDHWQSIEYLREETQSERSSVEDFLAHSFGVCLTRGDELLAWCLSEYNCGDRCEVGIATVDAYQQKGLGTLVGCAFVEEARQRGYDQIGWHCWTRNLPSAALARKIGFTLQDEDTVAFCIFQAAGG